MKWCAQQKWLILLLMISGGILLISCGGGGNSEEDTGGIGGTGRVTGPITGFGSIFINGIEFDTTSASVTLDGEAGDENDLEVGMIVTIEGDLDSDKGTGKAVKIKFERNLEGPIDSIDIGGQSLTALGITVFATDLTIFKNTEFASLAVGNLIEISGFLDSDSQYHATYIKLKRNDFREGTDKIRLKGNISDLNEGEQTFSLSGVSVSYKDAELEDLPEGGLANGQEVRVETREIPENNLLMAEKVVVREEAREGDEVELEGLVTSFTSSALFEINGQKVVTDSKTEFESGSSSDLGLNVRVEVEGRINSSAELLAEEIKFRKEIKAEIEARVESVEVSSSEVVVLGITIKTNSLTQLEDDSEADLRPFDLTDLAEGDWVEIRGYMEDGILIAARLKRKEEEDKIEVQGPLESVGDSEFKILGITVKVDGETEFDGAETLEEFFEEIKLGDIIEAEGSYSEGIFTAEEVESEDD